MLDAILGWIFVILLLIVLLGHFDGVWIPSYIEHHGIQQSAERLWCGHDLCKHGDLK